MNKKILMSIFIIGLLAFGLGYGTYSFFSSTETAGITFTAGTPDLQLSLDSTNWYNGLTVTPPVWAPGDTYAIYVYVRNMGDIGLANLFVTGGDLAGSVALADKINITDVAYTDTDKYGGGAWSGGYYWVHPAGGTYYNGVFGNKASPLTLTELCNYGYTPAKMGFCWGKGAAVDGDYLPVGKVQGFYIQFAFDQSADYTYQGLSVSFNLIFRGTDEPFTIVWP